MNFGICSLSVIPIRREPSDTSEMVSQLLFGETFSIKEQKQQWRLIECTHDNYQGWIDEKQFVEIDKLPTTKQITYNLCHSCTFNDKHIPLVLGCSLPNFDGLNFKINKTKFAYSGKTIEQSQQNISRIKKIALKYHNTPYLWGGRSPFGIDCSGLTQVVYKFLNINLPRDAYQQAEIGETLNFVEEAKPGDLAFFKNEEGTIIHVGIMLEEKQIIHASGKVRIDILDHVGIYNRDLKKYTHFLSTIKRIL